MVTPNGDHQTVVEVGMSPKHLRMPKIFSIYLLIGAMNIVQVRQSGTSVPPLAVSARAGVTSCGGLLGPITQPAASGDGYSQHMQTLVKDRGCRLEGGE